MKLDKRVTAALVGAAAVGATVGVAYYLKKQSAEVEIPVQLEQSHVSWLEEVAVKYTSGDPKKALQTLIGHCQSTSKDSAVEKKIFEEFRCNTCGKKEKVEYTAVVTGSQLAFVNRMTAQYGIKGGKDKTMRILLEYALNDVEQATIFGS